MNITLHDLVFSRTGTAGDDGITWMVTELEGWDSPSFRYTSIEPTSRHGVVTGQSLLGPRALVLKGVCKAPSETLYWYARNYLQGVCNNIFQERVLAVTEGTVVKTVGVIRVGELRISEAGISSFEFEVPLTANDPLKYGVTVSTSIASGASKTIAMIGNFPTEHIRVTASGTVSVANGKRLIASGVPSGTVFDINRRTAMAGSSSQFNKISPMSQWFDLQPGNNVVSNNGSSSITLEHAPAWL